MAVFLICVQIFFFRIIDVSLGTVRVIFTVRGKAALAALVGFCEYFVWFMIVRDALNSDAPTALLAVSYAAGFALGTYIGGLVADRFFSGIIDVQVITSSRDDALIAAIRDAGFAVSVLNVHGSSFGEEKYMLVIEIRGEHRKKLQALIREYDPGAFIMVQETKYVQNGFLK